MPIAKFEPVAVQFQHFDTARTARVYVFSYTNQNSFFSNVRKELGIPEDHHIYVYNEFPARTHYNINVVLYAARLLIGRMTR